MPRFEAWRVEESFWLAPERPEDELDVFFEDDFAFFESFDDEADFFIRSPRWCASLHEDEEVQSVFQVMLYLSRKKSKLETRERRA